MTSLRLAAGAVCAALVLAAAEASATTTFTVLDQTNMLGEKKNGTSYTVDGNWKQPPPDFLGNQFETTKLEAVFDLAKNKLTLNFHSKLPIAGTTVGSQHFAWADVAFDLDKDGVFETGFDRSTGKIVNGLVNADWKTSKDVVTINAIYGGWWSTTCTDTGQAGCNPTTNPSLARPLVEIKDGKGADTGVATTLADVTVGVVSQLMLDFTGKEAEFAKWTDGFAFFWGTGTCGNDPFYGMVPSAVPVPAALPLFLTALAGLGVIGRRRARSAG